MYPQWVYSDKENQTGSQQGGPDWGGVHKGITKGKIQTQGSGGLPGLMTQASKSAQLFLFPLGGEAENQVSEGHQAVECRELRISQVSL